MKRYITALFVCCCAAFCSCSDDDKLPNIRPADRGEFTDLRDGNVYGWVRIGDLEWMTSNLKYGAPYYECTYNLFGAPQNVYAHILGTDFEADYEAYGNFYTWEEAREVCPEGWRLPTDEDWKNLERALGMSAGQADAEGWRGNREADLLRQGAEGTGIALQLGGEVCDSGPNNSAPYWSYVGEYGYYWSATEVENNGLQTITVWYRKIFSNRTTVYRGTANLQRLMRVRCCRNAGSK